MVSQNKNIEDILEVLSITDFRFRLLGCIAFLTINRNYTLISELLEISKRIFKNRKPTYKCLLDVLDEYQRKDLISKFPLFIKSEGLNCRVPTGSAVDAGKYRYQTTKQGFALLSYICPINFHLFTSGYIFFPEEYNAASKKYALLLKNKIIPQKNFKQNMFARKIGRYKFAFRMFSREEMQKMFPNFPSATYEEVIKYFDNQKPVTIRLTNIISSIFEEADEYEQKNILYKITNYIQYNAEEV